MDNNELLLNIRCIVNEEKRSILDLIHLLDSRCAKIQTYLIKENIDSINRETRMPSETYYKLKDQLEALEKRVAKLEQKMGIV